MMMNDTFNQSDFDNFTNTFLKYTEPPSWSVYLFICIITIIMVLSVVGNGVILVVEQFNKQKTSTDWLVTFMSLYDLVLTTVNVPIYILMYNGSWKSVGSDALCGLTLYVQEGLGISSTLLLTVTALDRYVKTCRPLSTGITPRRAKYICVAISLFVLAFISVIPFYAVYDERDKCHYEANESTMAILKAMVYFLQITYILTFSIVIASYCKITITIRKRFITLKRISTNQIMATKITFRRIKVAPIPQHTVEQSAIVTIVPISSTSPGEKSTVPNSESVLKADGNKSQIADNSHVTHDETVTIETKSRRTALTQHNQSAREVLVNKTTALMFLVTVVFIMSWIPPWISGVVWSRRDPDSVKSKLGRMFFRRTFLVNTCTNPFFFIGMSSQFRQMAKASMRKLWNRIQTTLGAILSP